MSDAEYLKTITQAELQRVLSQLLYINRMNRDEFIGVMFPDSPDEHYNNAKWDLFREDPLRFLWACSRDKIEALVQYIDRKRMGVLE